MTAFMLTYRLVPDIMEEVIPAFDAADRCVATR